MLLKSASTPILGSLISSIADNSPNSNNYFQCDISITPARQTPPSCYSKLSYNHSFNTISCNSSPISPAFGNSNNGFPRSLSEGNLESLVNASNNIDDFTFKTMPNKFARRRSTSLLETIPSSAFHHLSCQLEIEESDEEKEEEDEVNEEIVENNEFYANYNQFNMQPKVNYTHGYEEEREENMYLAKGLGVADFSFTNFDSGSGGGNGGGDGGGGGYRAVAFNRDGGDSHDLSAEEHYKNMLDGSPNNPLFLRNYAQFLYQIKRDLPGAEEYYSRAILADPTDGEVLSHYAKLVWELHHDEDRALSYFERAVQAASEDSHVHAAYARFLWEIEDEEEEETYKEAPAMFQTGTITSITA